MGKHPNLEGLNELFASGTDFRFTDEEYRERTGADLPQNNHYIKHNSALANWAKRKGYTITDVQEEPIIRKTVFMRKEQERR